MFDLLLQVLMLPGIWLVNMGEVQLPPHLLARVVDTLRRSNIGHFYFEKNFLGGEFDEMRQAVRANRESTDKSSPHLFTDADRSQNWLVLQDSKSWFVPTRCRQNKEWALRRGGAMARGLP